MRLEEQKSYISKFSWSFNRRLFRHLKFLLLINKNYFSESKSKKSNEIFLKIESIFIEIVETKYIRQKTYFF